MKDKLKACPFCGSTNIRAPIDEDGWMCRTCGTESYVDWNRRPIEDALHARIAELEEAVGLITTLKPTMVMDTEHPLDMAKEVAEYVNARIAKLEEAQRWIPVGERLPEERQNVLALDKTGTAYHWEYSRSLSNIFVSDFTHWMPLPEVQNV